MKKTEKLRFVAEWREEQGIAADDTIDSDALDAMWNHAKRRQNHYEGLAEYCGHFDDSFLARITKRAKMRSLLELEVPAVVDAGSVPAKSQQIAVPAYIGTGTRRTGSVMIPMVDDDGVLTEEGTALMLEQALKQMKGHAGRYREFMDEKTTGYLDRYIGALTKAANSAAVRRHVA